jgi:hypothetical protein
MQCAGIANLSLEEVLAVDHMTLGCVELPLLHCLAKSEIVLLQRLAQVVDLHENSIHERILEGPQVESALRHRPWYPQNGGPRPLRSLSFDHQAMLLYSRLGR